MDWIERWWGLNPDGGTGTVEAGLILAVALALGVGIVTRSAALRASVLEMLRSWLRRRSIRAPR
jgi:hypothetical protein